MSWLYYLFIFFFQAEDGIRDVAVTGVQTCALPISVFVARKAVGAWSSSKSCEEVPLPWPACRKGTSSPAWMPLTRSEERRVGKECRSRWARYNCKEKERHKVTHRPIERL